MRLTGLSGFTDLTLAEQLGETLVVRARDSDGRQALIKTHASDLPSTDARERLSREHRTTTMATHPHLIGVHGFVDQPNRCALVLDDPGEHTLADLVESGDLDLGVLLGIAIGTAEALIAMHAAGAVHRAVDSHHILSTSDGPVLHDLYDAWTAGGIARRDTQGLHPAPEQRGTAPRPVDAASDQYALAATVDHACAEIGLEVPPSLRAILDRATDPDPRQRYRSMLGLGRDLTRAREALVTSGDCAPFELDIDCPTLRWEDPEDLIGRDEVLDELRRHIDAVAVDGIARVMVLRAEPGMGRSALVAELCDRLAGEAVLSGLGQFVKGGPTPALQAPLDMTEQVISLLLAAPEEVVDRLRTDLIDQLGPDLALAVQVIPALEHVVGDQPEADASPPEETISRIEHAVQTAISCITRGLPPLVVAFDDADRADRTSLRIFEVLAGHPDIGPLDVIITAGTRSPRLDAALNRLRHQGISVTETTLAPLTPSAITDLLAAGTGSDPRDIAPLGEAVFARSGGSPTVALADIWRLVADQHLQVDLARGRWTWDDEALEITEADDIDTVSVRRIDHLEPELRDIVVATAVAGRAASVEVLAEWTRSTHQATAQLVDRGAEARVLTVRPFDHHHQVLCADNAIRRAALEHAAGEGFDDLRHSIARAVLATRPHDRDGNPLIDDESRFVLIELLRGLPVLDEPTTERDLFLHLCRDAARHAHRNAAFQEALDLQLTALAVLADDAWQSHPELAFELHLRAAEHALILARPNLVDDLLGRMGIDQLDPERRVRVLQIVGTRAWTRGDTDTGLESLQRILADLGEPIPEPLGWADIGREYLATRRALAGRQPESFLRAQPLRDERIEAVLDAMLACVHLAYVDRPRTHIWLVLRGTRLTATYGLTNASAYFLTGYGMLNLSMPRGIETGLRFGGVGRELSRSAGPDVATMVGFAHDAFVRHWGEPVGDTIEGLRSRFRSSVTNQRREYGLAGGTFVALHGLLASHALPKLADEASSIVDDVVSLGEHRYRMRVEVVRQAIADLQVGPSGPILCGQYFDADDWLGAKPRRSELALIVHTLRAMVAQCMGDLDELRRSTIAARSSVRTGPGQAVLAQHWYHEAYLDACDLASARHRPDRLRRQARAERSLRRLRQLAEHAPQNHSHRVALIEAMLAEQRRVGGGAERAMDRYEQAVSLATANGALHDLGVIAERAAAFHAARDRISLGRHYAGVASSAWEAWGATAIASSASERLPASVLIRTEAKRSILSESTEIAADATSDTIAEASSLLGQELEVREFLERLIEILMRHTEATRGWLVLQSEHGPVVEVAGHMVDETVQIAPQVSSIDGHRDLCRPAVNYVLRTRQVLSLVDPASDRRLRSDHLLRDRSPRAMLGLPVGRSGSTTGVLVLESDTYTHAFEPERIEALRLLSAQGISAIDQARLSSNLSILTEDVTELRETASELTSRAETDALTGVANRAGMESRLHAAIRAAAGNRHHSDAQVGVLFCDLDDFKTINDHHGHAAGDVALVEIARRLTAVTRADDIVARIGGDEFVVISVGVSTEELEQMADRALDEVARAIEIPPDATVAVSISIGIGRADLGAVTGVDDIDALVQVADEAMYEAKHSGKNQVGGRL